jgi:hypothetical protein
MSFFLSKAVVIILSLLPIIGLSQSPYPKIVIDDEHNHIKPGADKSIVYTIKSGKGIVVDATGYDFSTLKKYLDSNYPDKIFVVLESGTFYADFNSEKPVILDKYVLKPLLGNDSFLGFRKGDAPIIALGTVRMQGKQPKMAQVWATTIHVK